MTDMAVDPGASETPEPTESELSNAFDSMFYNWVQERFARVEVTGGSQRATWCPQWWLHPEVVDRLSALWTAHIGAEAELEDGNNPAAMSDWWLRHWDVHRAVIFDQANGPFRSCNLTKGHLHDSSRDDVVAVRPARPAT